MNLIERLDILDKMVYTDGPFTDSAQVSFDLTFSKDLRNTPFVSLADFRRRRKNNFLMSNGGVYLPFNFDVVLKKLIPRRTPVVDFEDGRRVHQLYGKFKGVYDDPLIVRDISVKSARNRNYSRNACFVESLLDLEFYTLLFHADFGFRVDARSSLKPFYDIILKHNLPFFMGPVSSDGDVRVDACYVVNPNL